MANLNDSGIRTLDDVIARSVNDIQGNLVIDLGDDNWVTVAGLSVEEMGVNDFEVLFILI